MGYYIKKFLNNILLLHRYSKQVIIILIDVGLCVLSTWLAFFLRLEQLIFLKNINLYSALISVILAIPIFWLSGLYRTIFSYKNFSIILTISSSLFLYGLLYFIVIGIYGISGVPRSIGVLQPIVLFFIMISTRLIIKFILNNYFIFKSSFKKKNLLVYGAGDAGMQLTTSLENSLEYEVVGFLDDNDQLSGKVLLNKKIYSPINLERLMQLKNVNLVLIAIPSITIARKNQIIAQLSKYKIEVKTLPSISDIVSGKITMSDIKDFNINDLLNREEVKPDVILLNKNVYSKTVLVTGAGGSIGSELCRQIIKLKPKKLILLELNEFALYKISDELFKFNKNIKIITLLANVQDQEKLEIIFETFKVDTIYHAAAYKHVTLVEENICEGIKNNVFGTLAVAKASIIKKVSDLVLISSDKAVRSTNIMGATKRLSELCFQGIHKYTKDIGTNFSIVRFGNVLESSGSVIPKFKKQIKEGGPITLTHKDVTRYFMTITEASQLVIQAGSMGKNCEVFVLDMGESIKIIDLISKMIKLSGFSIKDNKNMEGDIEIKITGLRPGEKLYEEILIGDNPQKTTHPKIYKTSDSFIPFEELESDLNYLKSLIDENKVEEIKNLLHKKLKLYTPNSNIVDCIHIERLLVNNKNKTHLL